MIFKYFFSTSLIEARGQLACQGLSKNSIAWTVKESERHLLWRGSTFEASIQISAITGRRQMKFHHSWYLTFQRSSTNRHILIRMQLLLTCRGEKTYHNDISVHKSCALNVNQAATLDIAVATCKIIGAEIWWFLNGNLSVLKICKHITTRCAYVF